MTPGRLVSLIAICGMCEAAAFAQASSYLYGQVVDPSDAAVTGAAITVVNEDSGFRRAAASESDGAYAVGSLAPGLYKITVRKEGFRTMIRFHVRVNAAQATRADFGLIIGSVMETVTVEGASTASADGARISIGTTLSRGDLEQLPLDGRGILGLIELSPGTNVIPATRGDAGQFVANGQRPNANYFTVDGIAANHGLVAGGIPAQSPGGTLPVLSAFGSLDSLIPTDAVEQFEIRTSTSEAAEGRLPGADVEISSRAGSDQFRGSAAYTVRNQAFSANDWFANRAGNPRSALRENSGSADLGGPIWRDHTFFFLAYERMRLVEPFAWTETVPSATARVNAPSWAQPALTLFPQPNGAALSPDTAVWNGSISRPGGLQAASARLDHQLTSRVSVFARYSDSPSYNQFGDFQVNALSFRSWSGTAGVNVRLPWQGIFDFRFNHSVTTADSVWGNPAACQLQPFANQFQQGADCNLLVRFQIDGVGQVISGNEGHRRQSQWQAAPSGGFQKGGQVVRLGADFLRIEPLRRDDNGTLSVIADSIADLNNTNSFWVAHSPAVTQSARVDELSLFVHDSWQIARGLTVSSGLRWEYSAPPPTPAAGLDFFNPATGTIQTVNQPLWPRPYGHFAPRFGIAFSPGKDKRTVIRAGAGLYFESSLSIATDVINGGPLSLNFSSGRYGWVSSYLSYGFMPNLRLPEVGEWNISIERALSARDEISISYAGAAGWKLLRREVGGPGSTATNWEALTTNNGYSRYHAFIAQYRRRMARGLEALASYSWSHALDDGSSDSFLLWAGAGSPARNDYGASDFDLRHSLSASFNYELPAGTKSRALRGWTLMGTWRARTGFPITVLNAEQYTGIALINAFRPNLVPNTPVWLPDAAAPGGKLLNPQAFRAAPAGTQGNLGRNAIAGFGMWQVDLALRREFRLSDRHSLDLRVEAFNALNHPNFADPVRYLDSPLFGQSASMLNLMLGTGSPGSGLAPLFQAGAPRSLEGVVRFRF